MRRRVLRGLSWAYLAALAALALALRLVGDRWWPVTLALYLPRPAFALPLPLFGLAAWRAGERRLALPLGAAALVLAFPLLGLTLSLPHPADGRPTVRVMSYNVWYGRRGADALMREIDDGRPDVLAVEAWAPALLAPLRARLAGYDFDEGGDFLVASRWPIRAVRDPPPLDDGLPPAFRQYTLETPLGLIDLLVAHPWSPRQGIAGVREHEPGRLVDDADVRRRQVAALADAAARAAHPVVIAGDLNLPGLSETFHRYLGGYRDGFAEVGNGFGYTFPAHRIPWMRLDRVLAGAGLRFVDFRVGGRGGSDHCPVVATVTME